MVPDQNRTPFMCRTSDRRGPFGYTSLMHTFTSRENKLILKLKPLAPLSVLKIAEPCPLHSMCIPLPLFRVYKIDDASFQAEWNSFHNAGPKQVFQFAGVQPQG